MNGNDTIYFDSFRVEHNPKEIKKIMGNKIIQVYIYRIQSYDSIMYQYFCISQFYVKKWKARGLYWFIFSKQLFGKMI